MKLIMKNLNPLFLTLALNTTAITTQAAESTIPQQKQVSGYYQYQAGDVQITALLDGTNFMSPKLFQNLPEKEIHDILKKYAADQAKGVQTSVNAFLVNTSHSLVLVDSGAATCFGTHLGSVLSNLKASGHKPEQVDTILLTHLHPDHVCGISQNGIANFPNAMVYVSNDEANYWLNPKQASKLPKDKQAGYLGTVEKIKQAIAPYQAKQRFKTYQLGDQVQGFKVMNTAGHTPGHFSYALKTKDETVVFIGDIVHSHTVQFDKPETAIDYDIDPKKAVQTRLKQFKDYAKNGQTIAAPHLPFPGIGHIYSADDQRYQWIPIHFKD
ncbi:Glyoxylase, beta-lactamase superfamily II [Acinetobacter albensis]|uniref:Glyoxylase, beta-lactamase superfamily II n=2 Tax=Acinetobacter albensis TaxID=1673609 RepID=A0A1C4GUG9_9GAMM|nr:Glyoxylase, beta-lactamase superfamily II [Acinetobacter albensis]